jgi:AcrR family transcriptional regulator
MVPKRLPSSRRLRPARLTRRRRVVQSGPQEHSDGKLQHILHHAANVFAEKGFEGASIRDLSRASGVSLSTLYYYFESKQKLLYLIQKHAFASIVEELLARLSGVTDPEQRLRALVRNHLSYFLQHPVEMKVLAHEADELEPPYLQEVAEIKRRYFKIAKEIFEELRRKDRLRPVNARAAVLSLFGMMNWVYTWHNPRVDPGAEALANLIVGIFLYGVRETQAVTLDFAASAV